MRILGISAYFHDSAAALVIDGEVCAAAQEERFTRLKNDASFPINAIQFCLKQANIESVQVDAVVFYDKPLLKFERLLENYFAVAPRGFQSFRRALPVWLREKLFIRDLLTKELKKVGFIGFKADKILFSEHHLSHAASAFYPSPFEQAAILTIDGVGEWATTSISKGSGTQIERLQEIRYPHSLGLLYSAFTAYCGFKVNSGEYKLMGLAPYGKPVYADLILEKLINLHEDGSFLLNMKYFTWMHQMQMTGSAFNDLFGRPPRKPETEISEFYKDVAASIQKVTEIAVLNLVKQALKITGCQHICMAGGVALNCVANGLLAEEIGLENIYVQPASGDAGGALGAALAYAYSNGQLNRKIAGTGAADTLLGPAFKSEDIEKLLKAEGAVYQIYETQELLKKTASTLANGSAVGWFQGRMEFGPRALGNRSILADPRGKDVQTELNLKIKFRESFRPFAPVVMEEFASDWFELNGVSPHMLFTFQGKSTNADKLPAVNHVNGTSRVQSVSANDNLMLYGLLSEFNNLTGCPVLVNTSFNLRGEPMVCRPEDAYRCFMSTGLDMLVLGNCILFKSEQPAKNLITPELRED